MRLSARVSAHLSCGYRILFLILGFVLFFLSTPLNAHAQDAFVPSYTRPNVEEHVSQDQHTLVQSVTIEVLAALICQVSGIDVINPQKGCLGINTATGKLTYATPQDDGQIGGLMGMGTNMISALYTPPASGIGHMQYLASNFGIVKNTHAQCSVPNPDCGEPKVTGFTSLEPLQRLWLSMRNITFIFFVLVFMLIGIGIMLRLKIDAKAVMTLQNQLPKIVVSIVLISFSFAIVGFLIDAMWLTTYVGINLLTSAENPKVVTCPDAGVEDAGPPFLKQRAYNNLLNYPVAYMNDIFHQSVCDASDLGGENEISIVSSGIANLSYQVGRAIGDIVKQATLAVFDPDSYGDCSLAGSTLKVVSFGLLGGDSSIKSCVAAGLAAVIQVIASIIGILIAFFAIIFALFRLWWTLLKAYAYIIIYTITAPFWIMLGLLPNSSLGFSRWFKTVFANLIIFPAAAMLIIGARIIMEVYGGGHTADNYQPFVAPLVGNPGLKAFGALIAFGMLLIAPELLNTIRDALKTPASKFGGVIAAGAAAGMGTAMAPIRGVGGRLTRFDPHKGEVGALAGFMRERTGKKGIVGSIARMGLSRKYSTPLDRKP